MLWFNSTTVQTQIFIIHVLNPQSVCIGHVSQWEYPFRTLRAIEPQYY